MTKPKNKSIFNLILIFAFLVTIMITPWVNKDSMIIPKVILLATCGFYLLPKIINSTTYIIRYKEIKILLTIIFLIIIQVLIVMLTTDAPFSQQFFGRMGRGLGAITLFSLLLVIIASTIFVKIKDLKVLLKFLVVSCLISSLYSLLQSFGIDFIKWDSKTNGVIGTLGNPNFQSSFAALALVPTFILFVGYKYKYIWSISLSLLLLITVIRTASIQGIVLVFLSSLIFAMNYWWYKHKSIFTAITVFTLLSTIVGVLGMLNRGPLSSYLYKVSVQSRGDFWRSAFRTANSHPLFGVGIDSFGDSYSKYRDAVAVSHPWAEVTDNAHNTFLQYAATSGYPMLILQLLLIALTLVIYINLQYKISYFDKYLAAIFTAWLAFQAQSFISPENISMMMWNSIFTGTLIGVSILKLNKIEELVPSQKELSTKTRVQSYSFILIALLVTYPLFNSDQKLLQSIKTQNGDLAISSAKQYPESVLRYQLVTRELLSSNLLPQALDLARSAVSFNPNSPNLWALIVINPIASIEERAKAKAKILELDPLNKEVIDFEIK